MAPQPRVRQLGDTNGFGSFYESLPIVCKVLLTTYLITGLASLFVTSPLLYMYHSWEFVFRKVPQVWRLVFNFAFIGKPSINFLFNLVWLIQYGVAYEKAKFLGNAADSIAMAGWGMICIMLMDLLLPFCRAPFHGQALVFMLLYLWSKNTPTTEVSFFGVIKFQALYLPFALLFIDVIQGANPFTGLTGIAAGHMYWFGTEVFPGLYGRNLMVTPQWLDTFVRRRYNSNIGSGNVVPGRVTMRTSGTSSTSAPTPASSTPTTSARFRAFSGRGHKLN